MSRKNRIPELDGFRALAIGLVAWYHIWQQSWLTPRFFGTSMDFLVRPGYIFVDATVLLSAFLLFLPYVQAHRAGQPLPDTRRFYERRVQRIIPSYYFFTLAMLFLVAIPTAQYVTAGDMAKDVAMHLSFTFMFSRNTYLYTPLGAASWTLCMECLMYIPFPYIARACLKNRTGVWGMMLAITGFFRVWVMFTMDTYGMVVNQLINFLDVYAIGMASAWFYCWLKDKLSPITGWKKLYYQLPATALWVLSLFLLQPVIQHQAWTSGQDALQMAQFIRRTPLACLYALFLLSLLFSVQPLRWIFGNPVTKYLSAISMNYYLIHQPLAVQLKRLHIPDYVSDMPNVTGEIDWQLKYTALCFIAPIVIATLMTFLIEKPCSYLLGKGFEKLRSRKKAA